VWNSSLLRLFWTFFARPGSTNTEAHGALQRRIDADSGSFEQMQTQFTAAAVEVFGSDWSWLGVKKDGTLAVTTTQNQDNPLMPSMPTALNVAYEPTIPILGLDVWEHAYYLKYQNRRPEYISAFWNVANWDKVVEYYDDFASKQKAVEI